jgi:hypothetical protein
MAKVLGRAIPGLQMTAFFVCTHKEKESSKHAGSLMAVFIMAVN